MRQDDTIIFTGFVDSGHWKAEDQALRNWPRRIRDLEKRPTDLRWAEIVRKTAGISSDLELFFGLPWPD
ncbi:hypothetical protein CO251_10960 [Sulfobacillus sp. hq2]|nr:hypothetical protein CO251_10960 [Sulfobacillus sp. hq2]